MTSPNDSKQKTSSTSGLRMFPIIFGYTVRETINEMKLAGSCYLPVCIPWDMLKAHEKWAEKNHSQTLERLAERGGLSACEAVAILQDRQWQRMSTVDANETLCRIMATWIDEQASL